MPAELKSTSHGLTMVLTISNPENRNALGPEIYAAGIEALNAAESSPEVRSVIITGANTPTGPAFCAGGDLRRMLERRQQPAEVQAASIEALNSWIEAIRAFPKPVIAAVEGAAAGAGFSLALACDFIVSAQNAVFLMAYSNVALSPDGGGSWFLANTLPRQLVTELLMCGNKLDAIRLHALGLINRVVNQGTALTEALALAETLNARAPNSLASCKELVNEAANNTLPTHLKLERNHFVANVRHNNAEIGIAAFLSKTTPKYK